MRVELQEKHADVMEQRLARTRVPDLRELAQVAQLETAGLGRNGWRLTTGGGNARGFAAPLPNDHAHLAAVEKVTDG